MLCAQVALGREEEPVCLDMGTADGALAAGYAHPDAHRLGSGANPCQQLGTRRVGHRYVPSHLEVGGVHVNAPGWEGWVLQGLQVCTSCKKKVRPWQEPPAGPSQQTAALLLGTSELTRGACHERLWLWPAIAREHKLPTMRPA